MIPLSKERYTYQPYLEQLIPQFSFEALGLTQGCEPSTQLGETVGNYIAHETNITLPANVRQLAQIVRIPVIVENKSKDSLGLSGLLYKLPGHGERYHVADVLPAASSLPEHRLTLAHEAAHVILEDCGVTSGYKEIESFCEAFARTVLAPEHLLRAEIDTLMTKNPLDTIDMLYHKTMMPLPILVKQLVEVGVVSETISVADMKKQRGLGWVYFSGKPDTEPYFKPDNRSINNLLLEGAKQNKGNEQFALPDIHMRKVDYDGNTAIYGIDIQGKVVQRDDQSEYVIASIIKGELKATVRNLNYLNKELFPTILPASQLGF